MGYACPVCSDPQADAGHLANHLAFTAMLGDDDHEAWLDEHVPAWAETGEAELADAVADLVDETEFPQLFEDTAGGLEDGSTDPPGERSGALFDDADTRGESARDTGHGHDHGAGHDHDLRDDARDRGGAVDTSGPIDDEAAAVLEEARELTRRMYEEGESDGGDGADTAASTDADADGGDDAGR